MSSCEEVSMATTVRLTGHDGEPVWVNFDNVVYFVANGDAGSQIVFMVLVPAATGQTGLADVLVNESPEEIERLLSAPYTQARR
jgi:hypothetical protein